MLEEHQKSIENSKKFFQRTIISSKQEEIDLQHSIAYSALNSDLLDLALKKSDSSVLPNRHILVEQYLPQLDSFIKEEEKKLLSKAKSVSSSSDGFSDRSRRSWISLAISFVQDWKIHVIHPELVFVNDSCTSELIHQVTSKVYSEWLPENCLIATSTTDGASNERNASAALVKEGNDLWCCSHLANLCIRDIFDSLSDDTKVYREVVRKAHSLVVFIRGHSASIRKFNELSQKKRNSEKPSDEKFETLILDNVTRWDSTLTLLQRVVYFDSEIIELCTMDGSEIPREYILARDQFDLAQVMVDILLHFRLFSKTLQSRNTPTLCFVPASVDKLVDSLQPNSETRKWKLLSKSVIEQSNKLQELLVEQVKNRFSWVFEKESLALAAALLCPGQSALKYKHFKVTNQMKQHVINHLYRDALEFEDNPSETRKTYIRASLLAALELVEQANPDESECPLLWWSKQEDVGVIRTVVEMMLAIPASSAENERAHHGMALTQKPERNQLSISTLQREYRVQQYFATGLEGLSTAENRALTTQKARNLLLRYETWKQQQEKQVTS